MIPFTRNYEYIGHCTRVIDGDTVEVRLDLGFYTAVTIRVRLLDVYAPEIFRGYAEIREKGMLVKQFVESLLPSGTEVFVVTARDARSFNRYLGTIYTFDHTGRVTDINEHIRVAMAGGLGA
jgi:micrococcal nuclease